MGKISKNVANNKQKSKYIKPNVADYSYESGNDNFVLLSIKKIYKAIINVFPIGQKQK
jgi:hypothetical protein